MQNFLLNAWNFYREFTHKLFKVTILSFILITVACLQVSAGGHPQSVSIQGKDISIEKAFSIITKQTGYKFWYNGTLVNNTPKIKVDFRNKPLTEALDICMAGQKFTYRVVGKTIVLQPNGEKLIAAPAANPEESGPQTDPRTS